MKLSVTVKELGLSKYQFRRLRELVGKRYHSGKDELTITSERYNDYNFTNTHTHWYSWIIEALLNLEVAAIIMSKPFPCLFLKV